MNDAQITSSKFQIEGPLSANSRIKTKSELNGLVNVCLCVTSNYNSTIKCTINSGCALEPGGLSSRHLSKDGVISFDF